jgi:hypothetical protein
MKRCPGALTKDSFDEAFFRGHGLWDDEAEGRTTKNIDVLRAVQNKEHVPPF